MVEGAEIVGGLAKRVGKTALDLAVGGTKGKQFGTAAFSTLTGNSLFSLEVESSFYLLSGF